MKFTRSLPAKAKASENVPARMMIGKMLMRSAMMSAWKSMVRMAKQPSRSSVVLAPIQEIHSGCMKDAPLAPLITRK